MPKKLITTKGPGRPKGSENRLTTSCKEALQLAFDGLGGVPALIAWAKDNQTDFYKVWVKLLPASIHLSTHREASMKFTKDMQGDLAAEHKRLGDKYH